MSVRLDRETRPDADRGAGHARQRGLIRRIMDSIKAAARFAYDLLKDLF